MFTRSYIALCLVLSLSSSLFGQDGATLKAYFGIHPQVFEDDFTMEVNTDDPSRKGACTPNACLLVHKDRVVAHSIVGICWHHPGRPLIHKIVLDDDLKVESKLTGEKRDPAKAYVIRLDEEREQEIPLSTADSPPA